MSQKIQIDMLIDDVRALISLKEQARLLEKLRKKLAELNGEGEKATYGPIGKQALATAGAITGVNGITSAFQKMADVLRASVEDIERLRTEVANIQNMHANPLAGAIRNVGFQAGTDNVPNLTGPEVKDVVMQAAANTNMNPNLVAETIAEVWAGGGPSSREEAMTQATAAEVALQNYPESSKEELGALAKAMALNMTKFGYTAEQALGQIQRVNNAHIAKTNAIIASNVMSAGAVGAAYGAKPEEVYAMASYGAATINDAEGTESANFSFKLARELKERYGNLKDYSERLKFLLSASAEEQRKFMEGGEIGGKKFDRPELGQAGGAILETLFGNKKNQGMLAEKLATIGTAEDWAKAPAAAAQNVKTTDEFKVSDIKRRAESTDVEMGLANVEQGLRGAIDELLETSLKNSGVSYPERLTRSWTRFLAGKQGDVQNAIEELNAIRNDMLSETITVGGQTLPGRIPSADDRKKAAVLEGNIKYLRGIQNKDQTVEGSAASKLMEARGNLESFIRADTNITPNDERLYLRQAKDLDQQAKKLGMNSSATDANTKAIRELVEVQKKTLELAQKQISGGGRQQKPPPPPSNSPPVRRAPGMAALQTKGSFNRGVN